MVKRRRTEAELDGAAEIEATRRTTYNTVFVDTDLDTHLALVVAESDTVFDLKKKIMFEHLKCFPEKSELKIFSVKVQRKGHYYHLPDTMLVRSAFEGIKKGWFLHVEASSSQCNGNDRGLLCLTYPHTEADNLCPSDSLKAMAKQKVSNSSESYPAHGNLASSSIVKQKDVVKVIGETSQSGTIANKVKMLGSKESSRGSTEVNHGDGLTIAIPRDSTAHEPIKADLEQTLEDKYVRTHTTHKKKKKKKKINSFTCRDEVSARGVEQIESLLTNADSTIHVTPPGMKEIYPVKDDTAKKECLAPVSKGFDKTNLVGGPMHVSTISGAIENDVANTTREKKELIPNCYFEMPMNEKLSDASTKDPVPSFQLPDLQGAAESNFGRKKSKSKKSTHRHGLDVNNIVEASQNASASGQDKVHHDGPSDATTMIGSILQKSDVYHTNEIGKESKLSVTQGAETSLPSDNNKATVAVTEQVLSAEKALDDKGNIESGKSDRRKRKKNSLKKSAEKIPDELDGEDETRLKCISLAAGIGAITDHVKDQSKKGEISLDIETPQISPNTGVKESSHNKDLVQVISATCKSSEYAKVEMTTIEVENVTTIPSDLKVAEGHGKSKKKRTKTEVAAHGDDVSGAPSAMHNPPANHFVQEFNQDKTATCKSSEHVKEDSTTKEVEAVSAIPSDLKVPEGRGKSKRRSKRDVATHADDVSAAPSAMHNPLANHFMQECNQDKTATCKSSDHATAEVTTKEVETVSMTPFDLKVAEGHGNSGQSKMKRTKKKVAAHTDDVSGAPSAKRTPANHLVQESNQDINILPTTERKGASEQESKSAYASGSHQEIGKGASEQESKSAYSAGSHQEVEKATFIEAGIVPIEEKENEVEHLQLNQTDKKPETVNLVEKELKKKTKKSQKTSKTSKSIADIQDQDAGLGELTASNDNLRDVSPLPVPMEIDVSAKNRYVGQLDVTKLENHKNPGIDSNSKSSGKDLINTDAFRIPSDPLAKETLEEMHEPEVDTAKCGNLNFKQYSIPGQEQGEHEPEVNTDKRGSINFKQYFIPGQQQGEVAAKKPKRSNKDTKAGGKSKKDRVTSKGISVDISASRAEVTVPSPSSAKRHKTLEEAGKLATFDAPAFKKENKEAMDESMSSSNSKGSERFPENRKQQVGSEIQSLATRNTKRRAGDLEDCTQPEKGSLPTSGSKFGDNRPRSSDCKGGYSDCSTETPSDYSSSSGYSGEGSEISQASTPNGANGAKNKDAGGKNKVKSNILSPNVTIDMILRSSSRFKKAKVTAAQCQDEESQSVDVVPDSLPNL